MKISLKPPLQRFVAKKVKAGQYRSPSAVINEALEVLREQEKFTPEHEAYLRQELRRGLQQLASGQQSDFTARSIIAEEHRRLTDKGRYR